MSVPLALRGKGLWTDSSMDRTSASGADDTGSSPVPFTILEFNIIMGIKGYNHSGKKKVVVAVNPDGSVERVFDYVKDAAAYYGCDRHSISRSCRLGKTAHGFKWFYEEDFRRIYMNCEFEKLKWTPDPNRDRWTNKFVKGHKAGNGFEKRSMESKQKTKDGQRERNLKRWERGGYEETSRRNCKPVICLTDGKEFPSVKQAAEYYGLPQASVSGAIHRVGSIHGLKLRLKSQYDSLKEVI